MLPATAASASTREPAASVVAVTEWPWRFLELVLPRPLELDWKSGAGAKSGGSRGRKWLGSLRAWAGRDCSRTVTLSAILDQASKGLVSLGEDCNPGSFSPFPSVRHPDNSSDVGKG
ncbi:uncharacterized protein LOC144457729 [Phascolarctos cinereus]